MKRLSFTLLIPFTADFILDTIVANTGNIPARYLTKGLLMPLLLVFFITEVKTYVNAGNRKYVTLIRSALIFSFIGDIFLIGEGGLNFISGIGAFLIAQIFYILFFSSIKPFPKKNISFLFITALIILTYLFVLNYLFWPEVNKQHFVIPVFAYSIVLGLMLFTAINIITSGTLHNMAIFYFIPGAIIFVASDSMIALNSFYRANLIPGFYIMLTYCLAQFLIVAGALKFIKQKNLYASSELPYKV